jgi:hypothetical protein
MPDQTGLDERHLRGAINSVESRRFGEHRSSQAIEIHVYRQRLAFYYAHRTAGVTQLHGA